MTARPPARPTALRLLRIVWPFAAIVALLLVQAGTSLALMSAIRAFVASETLWSKAEKAAVQHLLRYAQSADEADFLAYGVSVGVIASDRETRLALDLPHPDYRTARAALVAAGTDAADVPGMMRLYRYGRRLPFMKRAIGLRSAADSLVVELEEVAGAVHEALGRGVRPGELAPLLLRVREIDAEITPLGERFSATLSGASRQTERALTSANALVALALVLLAGVRTRRLLRESQRFEHALSQSEARFERAVAGSSDGIWDWDVGAGTLFLSPRVGELLGHPRGMPADTPRGFLRRVDPADREALAASLRNHMRHAAPLDLDLRLATATGEPRWFRLRGRSVHDASGVLRVAGSLTDIGDHKRAEVALWQARDRAEVTLASIADAVITVDLNARVEYLNPVAERLTGWSAEAARGRPIGDVFVAVNEASGAPQPDPVPGVLGDGRTVEAEGKLALLPREGAPIAIDRSIAPIRERSGGIAGAVIVFHDMRRERQYAARLSHLASHDALTGLLNRREFEQRVRSALGEAREGSAQHAVLYLDLDQFKVVNDTCGHAAGDELLRQVGNLLRPKLREGDTLARLGGDEFGVLLSHCGPEPAGRIAETLRRAIADFRFARQRRSFAVGVSIGVVHVGRGPHTLESVLAAADAACYMAKDKGRNRVQVYRPEDSEIALRHGEMEWVNRIHRALADNRLLLYAQPIVPLAGTAPPHHELLVRLLDERNEVVPPMAFIPAAERYNLMPAIDRWVVRTAFAALGARAGPQARGTWAINLSGASIGDEDCLDYIREQFDRFRISPRSICFEITETTAVTSLDRAGAFIDTLRAQGCRFALDDFGVGVSSFTYLKHLAVDFLKIDGSFIKGMLQDPVDAAMVEAIHRVARVMGKRTIAEWVENRAIRAALASAGVDYAQGYGIAPPAPFDLGVPRSADDAGHCGEQDPPARRAAVA
jgi:diguanylate cyclase (GGDEF)-like protein/PAS domain S-box-containing protein